MFKKIRNMKAEAITSFILPLGALILLGAIQEYRGEWGKDGRLAVESCNQDRSCWYHADSLRP